LIKKYAPILNGFDLSHVTVGDLVLVPDAAGAMIIREGWAEPETERRRKKGIIRRNNERRDVP
jgi:hypothetical protein